MGVMRIISFIEDAKVIHDILTHPGLWHVRSRPLPKINDLPGRKHATVNLQIQPHSDIIYGDPGIYLGEIIFRHNSFSKKDG